MFTTFSDLNTALKDRQGDDATVLLATDNFFEVLAARVPGPDFRDQSVAGGWSRHWSSF
jgi:hypothetical protein